jgi:DNA replication protein DnaC
MIQEQVRLLSHQLRLYGIHSGFEARNQEALSKSLQPLEFLHLLLEDEVLQRKNRLAKSLLTRARFRSQVDLEDWDSSFDRGLSKQKLRELSSLSFFHAKENLLIMGRTGEGKTHLAVSLGRRLCQENISVAFLPVNLLFEEILVARTAGKYLGYLRKINQTQVLVLDDFGLRNYTHEEATTLVDILEERVKKGPVIVTSQVEPAGWIKLFEDPVIAEAVVDRLKNPSQKITLGGGTYRVKLGKSFTHQKGDC